MGLNCAVTSELIARLRDDLFTAGYTADTVDALWGSDAAAEVAEVGIKARAPLASLGARLPNGWGG